MKDLITYRWIVGNLSLWTVVSNEISNPIKWVVKSDRAKQENSLIYKIIIGFC